MTLIISNIQGNVLIELDLGHNSNPLYEFIVYFKATYGNVGYEIIIESDHREDDASRNVNRKFSNTSPTSMNSNNTEEFHHNSTPSKSHSTTASPINPQITTVMTRDDHSRDVKYSIVGRPSIESSYDLYALAPSTLSYAEGISIFAESLVTIWNSYVRGCKIALS